MKMYRNYDGANSTFGDTSVSAIAPNADNLSAFAALRKADGALTVTSGTGGWKGATGKAKLTCSTADGVHLSCTEALTLTTPPAKS